MKRTFCRIFCVLLALVCLCTGAWAADAEDYPTDARFDGLSLEQVVDNFRTEYGLNETNFSLSYYNTVTGEAFAYNDAALMFAASTYKLPLNLYYYKLEREGLLEPEAYIPNGGILSDCHYLSLVWSDNDVSEAMLYALGRFYDYKTAMRTFFSISDEDLDPRYYDDNYYSTAMMMQTLQYLYENAEDYGQMLDYMKQAMPDAYFKKYVTECEIAHKYGYLDSFNNDVGIIYADEPFLLAVYTDHFYGEEICAQAARLLKDYTDYAHACRLLDEQRAAEEAARLEAERLAAEEAARLETEQLPPESVIGGADGPTSILVENADGAASIGIIGGADGPTAIFITGSFGWLWWLLVPAGLLVVLIAVLCRRNRRKKK